MSETRADKIAWLKEPHAEKNAFFQTIAEVAGAGTAVSSLPVSLRGFPQTAAVAADCLARAKKQPRGPLSRAIKLAFLKGRYNWARRWFAARPGTAALCWQGLTGARRAMMLGARDAGAATYFAELSPLPGMRTLDPRGVNAEGSVPQDPAFYSDVIPDVGLLEGLRGRMAARPSRRADVGQGADMPDAGNFLFVPLQVPDDSQMILFSGWAGGVGGFIDALAQASHALPDGWHLRVKEHPSSRVAFTSQIDAAIAKGARMIRDNATDSFAQIEASKGVITVNSSMGLQAMFFDKPVLVTGRSFYGLPGLATPIDGLEPLSAALSDPETWTFDRDLRKRFLTWLATVYYIGETEKGFDRDRIGARLAGDL